ncbi:MAG: hypothetical protein ACFFB3_23805 [Candidatus Hodarchaeota archaeon]
MGELAEMGRRKDLELVEEIIGYLKKKKGVVTQGQLSSAVGINSETAEKWLNILHFVLNECPRFKFGKAGRYGILSIVEEDDISRIRTFDEIHQRIGEPGSLKSELASKFDKGKMGLVPVESSDVYHQTAPASSVQEGEDKSMKFAKLDSSFHMNLREELAERTVSRHVSLDNDARSHQNIIVLSEKARAVLRCTECGTEEIFPTHCGEQMDFEETEFVCAFKGECGEKIPLPCHCEKPMAVVIVNQQ